MRRALIFLVLFILIALGIFFWWKGVPTILEVGPSGTVATSSIQEETDVYKVQAEYPVFGIPALDARIKEIVEAGAADLKAQPAIPYATEIKNEFWSAFNSVYIGPDLVSVRLDLYRYTGGAHGGTVAIGITYDRAANGFLTLDDALALTGKTLPEISDMAREQVTAQLGFVQFPEGLAPTPDNFATFVVNEDAVVFIFQQYQVAAYAAGMPEIIVPRVK